MDALDRKILRHLQKDASIRNNALADMVGLAPSSCLRRVKALKRSGVIKRIVAELDPDRVGAGIRAVVMVGLSNHGEVARRPWIDLLTREPAVSQVYSVSGEFDAVVVLQAASMSEYQLLSDRLFTNDRNIERFVTQFVLTEHKMELSRPIG